jgi:hypoxanthine-DNA glycosylase
MISSFPHFINSQTETLILGTIPGVASLENKSYYAHKRNHFGKLCIPFFSLPISEIYIEKIKLLQENRLGLWDVLENCERKGSLDVHIKNQKKMIFNLYSKEFPQIIFNGKESHRY